MVLIEKMYFTLRDIARRWRVQMDDLGYLAENGELRVSTRLESVRLERGIIEIERGQEFRIPYEQEWFCGILDLRRGDAFRVFRDGCAEIVHFDAPSDDYVAATEPTSFVHVRLEHLVVRRCERDRIEAHHGETGTTVAEGVAFQHTDGYRSVRLGDLRLTLGPVQAKVVEQLHRSALPGEPWRSGKAVLAEAGASSMRMSDVFKSRPRWQDLIESDRRGRYRLRLKMR